MVSEQQIADMVGATPEEVQAFLHDHIPYEERMGMHDVLNCTQCQEETEGQR